MQKPLLYVLMVLMLVLVLVLSPVEAAETLLTNGDGSSAQITLVYGSAVTMDGAQPVAWEDGESLTARLVVANTEALGFGSFVLNFDPAALQVTGLTSLLPPGVTVVENYIGADQVRFAFSLNEGLGNIDDVAPGGDNPYGLEEIAIAELSFVTLEEAETTSTDAGFSFSASRADTRISRRGAETLERLDYTLPDITPLTVLQRVGVGGVLTFLDYLAHTSQFQVTVSSGQSQLAAVETADDPAASPGYAFSRLMEDGSYTLEASGPGYMTVTQTVQVNKNVAQAGNNPLSLDLTLTPGDIVQGLGIIGSDGLINTEDFAMISSNFRQQVDWTAPEPEAELQACDLDRDGTVTIDDIAYVILYWQED